MIKWLNKSGNEVETNEHPDNIKAAKAAGWTLAEEAEAKAEKQNSRKGSK